MKRPATSSVGAPRRRRMRRRPGSTPRRARLDEAHVDGLVGPGIRAPVMVSGGGLHPAWRVLVLAAAAAARAARSASWVRRISVGELGARVGTVALELGDDAVDGLGGRFWLILFFATNRVIGMRRPTVPAAMRSA